MRKGDDLTIFTVPKVEKIQSLNLPDPQGPARACSGKTLLSFPHLLSDLGGIPYKGFYLMVSNIKFPRLLKIWAGIAICIYLSLNKITLSSVQWDSRYFKNKDYLENACVHSHGISIYCLVSNKMARNSYSFTDRYAEVIWRPVCRKTFHGP